MQEGYSACSQFEQGSQFEQDFGRHLGEQSGEVWCVCAGRYDVIEACKGRLRTRSRDWLALSSSTQFFFEFARPLGGMLENNRGSFDCDLARGSHASFAHSDDRRAPQRARDARIQCSTTRTHSCEGRPRPKRARSHGVRRAGERYGASVAADHMVLPSILLHI